MILIFFWHQAFGFLARFQSTRNFLFMTGDDSTDCFDEALIYVKGGSGGQGSNAFKFGKGRQHLAPYGGSGGDGSSVYFRLDPNMNTLRRFVKNKSFRAEIGQNGDKEYLNGASAKDLEISLPSGTLVYENETRLLIGEISPKTPKLLVAKGGKGGKGNSANYVKGGKVLCSPPDAGEKKWLKLELKLLADVGLIGKPNAGKSTLLKAITNADPKIADYAFTTLVPNLGVCFFDDDIDKTVVMADIPGLIEGAHLGVGLGKGFLRHVERCQILLHLVSGVSPDPIGDYLAINKELALYSSILATKPQVVLLNKIDIPSVAVKKEEIITKLRMMMPHSRLLVISAKDRIGTHELKQKIWDFLCKIRSQQPKPSSPTD